MSDKSIRALELAKEIVHLRDLLTIKERELRKICEPEEIPGHCNICGEPMPPGEETFKYHGSSGPCPKDNK